MDRIVAEHITKTFSVGISAERSTLAQLLSGVSGRDERPLRTAVRDVSLTAREGEIVGIIGRNGSGKSTLLRIIAGILRPDSGRVETHGRLVPLIHLDTGVRPRLTMRENIYLAGAFLGLPPSAMRRRLDAIVSYAGLEEYIDTKWYQFSDGMRQKAVFSIGIHADPDILLLDEAFSAGDEAFRKQSVETLLARAREGVTVLLVGHGLTSITECTDRVVWIDAGRVRREGAPKEIVNAYLDETR